MADPRLDVLRRYGLGEYEARIYLGLCEVGTATAAQIAKAARVPGGKVYESLGRLAARGLVEVLDEYPKRYSPRDIAEYADRMRADHEAEVSRIRAQRDELNRLFPAQSGSGSSDAPGAVTLVRGRTAAFERARMLAAGAKRSVVVYGTKMMALRLRHFTQELESYAARGVEVRFLVPIVQENLADVRRYLRHANVRHRDHDVEAPVAIWAVDDEQAMLMRFVTNDASPWSEDDVAICIEDAPTAAVLAGFANREWDRAQPLAERVAVLESELTSP